MMKLDPEKLEMSTRYINGPFQTNPLSVTLSEKEVHRSGVTTFDADIYLSYFPKPNPDPDSPLFDQGRKRMKIRVVITWKDRIGRNIFRDHEFQLATIVHDERYAAKPSLKRLTGGGE